MTALELMQQAVVASLLTTWQRVFGFFPLLIVAVIVFIVGWIVSVAVGRLIERVLAALRLNEPFERVTGLRSTLERAGLDLNIPKLIGGLVKWFLIIVTLLAASDVLGLHAISSFLNDVIAYIPNVVVAAVILVAGVIFANFLSRTTRASVESAHLPHANTAAAISRWAVIIFTLLAALDQLGVAPVLIQTLFTAFAAMIAIAGGLAFGLGGKEQATRIMNHLESELSERRK